MNWNKLFFLPEWNEESLHINEGEEWKNRPAIDKAKALYNQWREVFHLAVAFAETLHEDSEEGRLTQKLICENGMIVGPKIRSVAGDALYILKMENAAIIRTNCRQLMEQVGFAVLTGIADESHGQVIKQAMDDFRILFQQWVATFQKDAYTDDWGLFI